MLQEPLDTFPLVGAQCSFEIGGGAILDFSHGSYRAEFRQLFQEGVVTLGQLYFMIYHTGELTDFLIFGKPLLWNDKQCAIG